MESSKAEGRKDFNCAAQAGFKFRMILLPQPPRYLNYRYKPPCPAHNMVLCEWHVCMHVCEHKHIPAKVCVWQRTTSGASPNLFHLVGDRVSYCSGLCTPGQLALGLSGHLLSVPPVLM